MTTPETAQKPHSAEYFGEQRDFWWNRDFLELMARRLRLAEARFALDVGSGVGHWGRTLLPHLAPEARVIGIDREEAWVKEAHQRAEREGLAARMSYRLGSAEAIPFHDGVFDLVTCQTVLMHVRDPRAVLGEMIRVAAPGGLVLMAEPNNVANSLILGSTLSKSGPERALDLLRFHLVCSSGKERLGEGSATVGDLLPGYAAEAGLADVQVYTSDKASALYPPYAGREQQALRDQAIAWSEREFWIWDRADTHRFFIAGGGSEAEFERLWGAARAASRDVAAALRAGTEHCAGGGVQYLVSGRKPLTPP
jgi:SAM-dependent methyltransferase